MVFPSAKYALLVGGSYLAVEFFVYLSKISLMCPIQNFAYLLGISPAEYESWDSIELNDAVCDRHFRKVADFQAVNAR